MARQNFVGYVLSQGKMAKTVKVRVMHKVFNKSVQKELLKKKDYLVHDENEICREGDMVRIEATRPLSARKFFAIAEIKKNKGQKFAEYEQEAKQQVIEEERQKSAEFLKHRDANDRLVGQDLYKDMDSISSLRGKSEYTADELKQLSELKHKYGITSWDDSFENQEFFHSEVAYLAQKVNQIKKELDLAQQLNQVLQNDKSVQLLEKKLDLSGKQNNIRKNLIRKYLSRASETELEELGLQAYSS